MERHAIETIPGEIVGNYELGYFIGYGKYRLTKAYRTLYEAQEAVEEHRGTLLEKAMFIIAEHVYEEQEAKKAAEFLSGNFNGAEHEKND